MPDEAEILPAEITRHSHPHLFDLYLAASRRRGIDVRRRDTISVRYFQDGRPIDSGDQILDAEIILRGLTAGEFLCLRKAIETGDMAALGPIPRNPRVFWVIYMVETAVAGHDE